MDYYSYGPEIFGLRGISSSSILSVLKKEFGRLGLAKTMVSDNETQLVSIAVSEYIAMNGVRYYKVALYAPVQNGLVERMTRVIDEKIKE